MKINIGFTDRIIRFLLTVFIAAMIMNQMVIGLGAIILGIIAVVLFLTSVVGICPLYTLLGIKTKMKTKE